MASIRTIRKIRELHDFILDNPEQSQSLLTLAEASNTSQTTLRKYLAEGYIKADELGGIHPGIVPAYSLSDTDQMPGASIEQRAVVKAPRETTEDKILNVLMHILENVVDINMAMDSDSEPVVRVAEPTPSSKAPVGSKTRDPLLFARKEITKRLKGQWGAVEDKVKELLAGTSWADKMAVYLSLEYMLKQNKDALRIELQNVMGGDAK